MRRRFAALLTLAFVACLTLASYAHCWPMLTSQLEQMASHEHHEHGAPPLPDGSEPELTALGLPSTALAVFVPVPSPGYTFLALPEPVTSTGGQISSRRTQNARAGPAPFREIHARTGRLLI